MDETLGQSLAGFDAALRRLRSALATDAAVRKIVFADADEWINLLTYKLVPLVPPGIMRSETKFQAVQKISQALLFALLRWYTFRTPNGCRDKCVSHRTVDDQSPGDTMHFIVRIWVFVIHSASYLLMFLISGFPCFAEEIQHLRLATGPADGTYRILGAAMKLVVEETNSEIRIELLTTAGSIENMDLLARGVVQFALVQQDVAWHFKGPATQKWSYALVLTQEPVHLVLRNATGKSSLGSLAGRDVYAGAQNSGTRFTARSVVDSLGISDIRFLEYTTGEDAVAAMRRGELDAGFFVGTPPVPLVAYLLADPAFQLARVTPDEMISIRRTSAAYTLFSISPTAYPRMLDYTSTVSVSTVLLCSDALDEHTVSALCAALLDDISDSKSILRRANNAIDLATVLRATETIRHTLHTGSESGLRSISPITRLRALYQWLEWSFFVLVAISFLAISLQRPLRIRLFYTLINMVPYSTRYPFRAALFNHTLWRILTALASFMLIWLAGTVTIYYAENDVNLNFSNLHESSLSMLLYLFSNVEGRIPATSQGWIVFIAMLVLGLLVGAYITGEFATAIIRRTIGRVYMNKDIARNSFLLIGWNDRAEQIVHEFFCAFEDGVSEFSITVLTESTIDPSTIQEYISRGVTFLSGNCTNKKTLLLIGASKARSIVILADDDARDPDARTTMSILAIKSLFNELKIPVDNRPHICAEVLRVNNVELARDAGACAVVCHQHIGTGLLAQAAITDKILSVYQNLLTYSREGCEIYILSSKPEQGKPDIAGGVWAEEFEGKAFKDAQLAVFETGEASKSMLLLGFMREATLHLAPSKNERLQLGDDLVVLAWERPKIKGA
jgi:hypothetical protein